MAQRERMTRGRVKTLWVAGGASLAALFIFASLLSAQYGARTAFREGDEVELTGTISENWLTVSEGNQTGQQFELVKNGVLEDLQREASPGAVYRVSGEALSYQGTNLILIGQFKKAPYVTSTSGPKVKGGSTSRPAVRGGSTPRPPRGYRGGS